VKCGTHATCKTQGEEAFCVCDEGWTYDPANIAAGCQGTLASFSLILSNNFIINKRIRKRKENPMANWQSLALRFILLFNSLLLLK
jgi:hypothetical protein